MNGKGVQTLYTEEQVSKELWHLRLIEGKSLRQIAQIYGVKHAIIQRGLKGEFPKTATLRRKLNLPALIPAQACTKCGQVHVTKRCTAKKSMPRSLFDWPKKALRQALDNREEI